MVSDRLRVECPELVERLADNNMPFFIYILRSASNNLYIGQTNNLNSRTQQHFTKDWKAAKFTKNSNNFELVYHEEYKTRIDAMRRETQLKGWSRAKKKALIAGNIGKLKILSSAHTKIKNK